MRVIGSVEHQTPKNSYVAVSHEVSPYISVYNWSPSGFGTKFSNPATALTEVVTTPAFNNRGNYIACSSRIGGNNFFIYNWSSAGFGTAVSVTAEISSVQIPSWSPDDKNIGVDMSNNLPYFQVYPWNNPGLGTKYADPATAIGADGPQMMWSNSGNAVVLALRLSTYMAAYAWNNGWGTRYTNPGSIGTSHRTVVPIRYNSGTIIRAVNVAIGAVGWSDSSGFGTFQSAVTLAANGVSGWPSLSGNYVVAAGTTSPYIAVAPYTTSIGTKYADPATLPTGTPTQLGKACATFSYPENAVGIAHATSPFVTVYPWSSAGYGTKYTNPATLPAGNGYSIVFFN